MMKPYDPFNSRGEIILPTPEQLAEMPAGVREQVGVVLAAADDLEAHEKLLASKTERVAELTKIISAATTELSRVAPQKSFQNIWADMVVLLEVPRVADGQPASQTAAPARFTFGQGPF